MGLDKVFVIFFLLWVTLFGIRLSNGLVIVVVLLVVSWLRGGNLREFLFGVYSHASVWELEYVTSIEVGVRRNIDLVNFGRSSPSSLWLPLGLMIFFVLLWGVR